MSGNKKNKSSLIAEGLRVLYTNADQLPNKLHELELRIKIENPHLIIINEVNNKVKTNLNTNTFQLQGYQMFHENVSTEGRGIIIYVQNTITEITEVSALTKFDENKILSLDFGSSNTLIVACIYRSESGTSENNENLRTLLKEIDKMKQTYKLVVGDFNYKHIDWENYQTSKNESSDEHQFINCIQDIYWYQNVNSPTRYREATEPSTLDLILTNEENLIDQLTYQSPLGKSDHSVLSFKVNIQHDIKSKPRKVFSYDKGNYQRMINDLDINWENEFETCDNDINQQWEVLKTKIQTSEKQHIPTYQTTGNEYLRKGKIPLSPEIRREIRKKHRMWQRTYETKSKKKYNKWRNQRKKVSQLIKDAEIAFETDIANESKSNPKKLWKYVKSKTRFKTNISSLLNNKTGRLTKTQKEQADALAAQFASVMVSEPDGDIPTIPDKELLTPPLSSINITEDMVLKKLKNLDATKSPGPDQIHPRVLKETATAIAPALTILYRNVLSKKKVPDEWKTAVITAIYKKGPKSDPGNYRPVSLTCIVCKILESIVYDSILNHLLNNNLLTKSQYGFICRRSASLQLLTVMEIWCNILDNDGTIDDVNMDFSKAFDSVPHKRLLSKVKSYGITGDVHAFIQDFLTNRKQKVQVNDSSSDWSDVISGVPQGSVIASLLFVIYINDLPEKIKSAIFLFADDCKFFRQVDSEEDTDIMQEDLNTLHDWSNKWLLKFHPDKCVTLRISLNRDPGEHTYYLGDKALKNVDETKDLGILVDTKLKFQNHTSVKVNKANQMWGTIKRTFKHMNEDIFKKLFCSHVRPHLEYAIQFWAPYLRKNINQIEKVQRRATKYLPGYQNLSYKERLTSLELPTLAYRRLCGSMIEVYKILNVYDEDVIPKLNIRNTSTRGHGQKLFIKAAKKHHPKHHSFSHRVTNPWNSLPPEVVDSPNLNIFKNRLDKHWSTLQLKYDHEARDFET